MPGRHRRLHEAPGQGTIELTAQWYCQGEPFQEERQKLFAPAWQLLGRASILQQPGDYLCANLAGWPLVALVNREGKPAAFNNVCRHQRMGVVEIGAGNSAALRCKYHGWTYDLDGRFASAPATVAPADPSSPENNLERVPLAIWHGLAFVSQTGTGESPAAFLDACAIDETRFSGESSIDIGCNWKLYIEHCLAEDPASWAWPALIGLTGIALSMVVALLVLDLLGYTFNALVALGLLVAVGVVVDDALTSTHALLSRGVAGVRGQTLVVNLPGSPGGCRDGFDVLRPALDHALKLLAGEPTAHKQT